MHCRSCLAQVANDDINLNDSINDNLTYYDCFFMCTQLCIDKEVSLTAKLCRNCAQELKRILQFVQTAHESDKQFKRQNEEQHKNENYDDLQKDGHNERVVVGVEPGVVVREVAAIDNQMENNKKELTAPTAAAAAAAAAEYVKEDIRISNNAPPSKTQIDSTEHLADKKLVANVDDDDDFKPELVLCILHEIPIVKERFKCQQCTKAFYRQTDLHEHQQIDHGSFCTSCELYFSDNTELMHHNCLVHSHAVHCDSPPPPPPPPSLTLCHEGQNCMNNDPKEHTTNKHDSSSFSTPNEQATEKMDMNSALDAIAKYRCSQCLKSFTSEHLLMHHEKTTHINDPSQIIFVCDQCKRDFKTQSALDYHCRVVHTERDNICEICGNAFKLKNQLKNHVKLHLEKNLRCPFCDKRYARNIDLTVHLRSHTGEQPYACHLCDKRFAIKVRLTYHLQRHLGIQHKCPHCGSVFNSRQKLKIHSYKHSGMPYRCEMCKEQRGFPSRETFRRHLKGIHQSMLSNEELDAMFKRNTGKTKRIVTIDEMIVPD